MKHILILFILPIFLTACTTMPHTTENTHKTNNNTQVAMSSQVFIIFFEKDKKANLLHAISQYHDEIMYDYGDLNGLAVKITAKDIAKRVQSYQKIDGVSYVGENRPLPLRKFY